MKENKLTMKMLNDKIDNIRTGGIEIVIPEDKKISAIYEASIAVKNLCQAINRVDGKISATIRDCTAQNCGGNGFSIGEVKSDKKVIKIDLDDY